MIAVMLQPALELAATKTLVMVAETATVWASPEADHSAEVLAVILMLAAQHLRPTTQSTRVSLPPAAMPIQAGLLLLLTHSGLLWPPCLAVQGSEEAGSAVFVAFLAAAAQHLQQTTLSTLVSLPSAVAQPSPLLCFLTPLCSVKQPAAEALEVTEPVMVIWPAVRCLQHLGSPVLLIWAVAETHSLLSVKLLLVILRHREQE